ncbi:hypothetical protein [uncultured Aquimarina sp.]|uniref:hypothetical protein n=1 Tax=uncultured Aquimarina sp. TaxID=575652 RepID=UPI0026071F1F|nr:hypothetical protein [uncultured Aquimarina sp.]
MKYYEEINNEKNIFASELKEPNENSFEFELTIGTVSEKEEDVIVNGINIGSARRINSDQNGNRFKIKFDNYISYSVIDERFDKLTQNEIFSGNRLRIYSDSNFLNYIKADMNATSDYPGNFKHYAFITLNHIINVASEKEPEIIKLK